MNSTETAVALAEVFAEISSARRGYDFEALEVHIAEALGIIRHVNEMWCVEYSVYYVGEGWDLSSIKDYTRYFVSRPTARQFEESLYDRFEESEGAFLEGYPKVSRMDNQEVHLFKDYIFDMVSGTDNLYNKASILLRAF